ncbi:MAG: MSMEG_0565 family glycosyltransferase [Rhodomicrobium sp.]
MMPQRKLRIAILTHSTNPRGGVVHALALGEALEDLGHRVTVHAPDAQGTGFFREPRCRTVLVPASPAGSSTAEMVESRIADYLRYFELTENRRFDVWHAQDGISGNALATMKERKLIPAFAQTVHHIDSFADPRLLALQARAILAADHLFAVSGLWRDTIDREFGRRSTVTGNGVDRVQFSPAKDRTDAKLAKLLPREKPLFLAIGGIEQRKNSIRLLEAFVRLRTLLPNARLVIAGGASLLDHSFYQERFGSALAQSALPRRALTILGPMRQELMPALYRSADALVFPSVKEGFGLVVLEAMASGLPVITSHIAPFTEYLAEGDVLWCDPADAGSIEEAMMMALELPRRRTLSERGLRIAGRHSWLETARRHLPVYDRLLEPCNA